MHDLPELGPLAKSLIQTVVMGAQLVLLSVAIGVALRIPPVLMAVGLLVLLFGLLWLGYWAEERYELARKKAGKTTGWMQKTLLKMAILGVGVALIMLPVVWFSEQRQFTLVVAAASGWVVAYEKFWLSRRWKRLEKTSGEWGRYH